MEKKQDNAVQPRAMTDEQIEQGLQHCIQGKCSPRHPAKQCPYYKKDDDGSLPICLICLMQDALAYIQRAKVPDCFGTDKVPVTDCEGCEYLYDCNNYFEWKEFTVWQFLDTFTPSRRAEVLINRLLLLQCKYAKTELDALDVVDAIQDDLAEWLQSSAKDFFGVEE